MSEVFLVVVSMSLTGSILFGVVSLINKKASSSIKKQWMLCLWLMVLVSFITPLSLKHSITHQLFVSTSMSETTTMSEQQPSVDALIQESNVWLEEDNNTTPPTTILETIVDLLAYGWILWISVVALLLLHKFITYQNFKTYVLAGATSLNDPQLLDCYSDALDQVIVKRSPEVYINPLLASPILLGAIKPVIVLPNHLLSDHDLYPILLHETLHYKRHDTLVLWFTQVAKAVHWFNPLIYLFAHNIELGVELACDESVLELLHYKDWMLYGDTLLHSLDRTGSYHEDGTGVRLHKNKDDLRERLLYISQKTPTQKFQRPRFFGILTIVLVLFLILGSYHPFLFQPQSDQTMSQDLQPLPSSDLASVSFHKVEINLELTNLIIQIGEEESIQGVDRISISNYINQGVLTLKDDSLEMSEQLTITLRKDKVYDSIHITSSMGDVSIQGVQAKTMTLTSELGSLTLSNLTITQWLDITSEQSCTLEHSNIGTLQAFQGLGRMNINNLTINKSSFLIVSGGTLNIETQAFQPLTLTSKDLGTIDLQLIGDASNYSISASSNVNGLNTLRFNGQQYSYPFTWGDGPIPIQIFDENSIGAYITITQGD